MEMGYTRELYLKSLGGQSCKSQLLKVTNKENPPRMFSLVCNLLKMNACSNDFEKIFLAKNPCDWNQMKSNQIAAISTLWTIFIFNKSERRLRRLKLVGFFTYQLQKRKNVSNRFILWTYQLRCCDDVSALSRTLKLVSKKGSISFGYYNSTFFWNLQWFSLTSYNPRQNIWNKME